MIKVNDDRFHFDLHTNNWKNTDLNVLFLKYIYSYSNWYIFSFLFFFTRAPLIWNIIHKTASCRSYFFFWWQCDQWENRKTHQSKLSAWIVWFSMSFNFTSAINLSAAFVSCLQFKKVIYIYTSNSPFIFLVKEYKHTK